MKFSKNYSLDKKYLIAVSGGPDSMALWTALIKKGYSLIVAHVNYHHRDISNQEEEMIKEYAKLNNCKIEILHAYYSCKDGNFEDWARKIRYTFFQEIGAKYQVKDCFVAHHMDDLIETYLMQKKRGYVSYYGLKEENKIKGINIIRPCLNFTKNDLIKYCEDLSIPFSYDITNEDVSLLRNRIRHNELKNMSLNEKQKLVVRIEEENKKLQHILNEVNKNIDETNVCKLIKLDEEIFDRLIYTKVHILDEKISLSKKRIKEIYQMLISPNGNQKISLSDNYEIVREYECLKIVKKEMHKYCIVIDTPRVIDTKYFYFDLISDPSAFYINENSYPLMIRNADPKHKIKIGTIHKSVNRIFIDEKIPYHQRLYWPEIVNNKGEIIFLPRSSKDENGRFIVKDL